MKYDVVALGELLIDFTENKLQIDNLSDFKIYTI